MTTNQPLKNIARALAALAVTVLGCGWGSAQGAVTDISNAPLVTSSTTSVLPNVMFVLDDSGSMGWSYMPDNANDFNGAYGYASNQCNGVYYDPGITYTPPVTSTGTSYANSSFTAAWTNGYNTGAGTTNLSTSFKPSSSTSYTAGSAYYYAYSGTQTTAKLKDYYNTSGTFYQECNSGIGSTPGSGVFTKVTIVSTTPSYTKAANRTDCAATTTCTFAEESQNFANWYSYYRTRMLMMKTAAGIAFQPINENFRVAFMTINNNVSPDILNFSPFDVTQKSAWYTKLYEATPSNSTPLRQALANVGRIYGHKITSLYGATITDPVQYACQQNFTILSTDGFWNGNAGFKLDGTTAVGNQDGAEPRPYNDGGGVTYSKSTSQIQKSQTQVSQTTNQLLSRTTQIQSSTSTLQKQISQLQARTSTLQSRTGSSAVSPLQRRDSSNYGATYGAWYDVSADGCTVDNDGKNRNECRGSVERRDSSNSGASYGAWYDVSADGCTVDNSGTNQHQCQDGTTSSWSAWANAASCTSSSTTQCQYATSAWAGVSSCTPAPPSPSSPYTVATATECQTVVTTPYATATSCTATTTPDTSGYTTQCQYLGWTTYANASSCTDTPQSPGSPYSGPAMRCRTLYNDNATDGAATGSVNVGGVYYVGAGSCTASSSGGRTISCYGPLTTGPTFVASCPCSGSSCNASSGNQWTQTSCTTTTVLAATPVSSCTAVTASEANGFVNTLCNTVTTGPTSTGSCTAASPSASNSWTTTTCSAGSASGGTSDTLADVAEYYYATDLRTSALGNATGALGTDVTANIVPKSGLDAASWQHMTTFTLGLGARGKMVFDPSYKTQTAISFDPADYYSIGKDAFTVTANSATGVCSWQTTGTTCNWPVPGSNYIENIDDLWHAAVNGRGTYFSATNPTTLATSLTGALEGVSAITGASASATTSSPNVTAGDNFVFSSTFTTQEWDGELIRQQLDLTTGSISSTIDWSAQAKLDAATSRTIYTFDSAAANKLKPFLYSSLSAAEQAYFNAPNISTTPPSGTGLSQFLCATASTCLSAADQTLAAGANLVNFLRGDRTHEGSLIDNTKYYRQRAHILGDTVDAEAVFVKTPHFNYADGGYGSFKSSQASRTGVVYIAANDGMLHAFRAGGTTITTGDGSGDELWAYVPSMVLPELYKLADKNYATKHRYFVDGTPTEGDVYFGGAWHTILVGGLNAGGRGYYALDITDPAAPKALWEFTDANMGYTFGNPLITKLKNGTWVVLLSSGYNNPGDGMGHLYVLNAATGALIRDISTGVGSSGTPSGLGRINAFVRSGVTDNTVLQAYGGDMLGNLWRFDVNGDVGSTGYDAQLLATLRGPSGNVQPITSKPEVTVVTATNGNNVVVYVGTGRYLGTTDLGDTSQQTIYGIKDPLATGTTPGTAIFSNPRTINSFVQQILTSTTCPANSPASVCSTGQAVRTSTNNTVDFATQNGWFVDLLDSGERANTDPQLQLGVLGFTTNVPSVTACTIGGYSFRYFFDYRTGGPITSPTEPNSVVSSALGNALATRPVYIELPSGEVIELTTLSGSIAGGEGGAGNIVTNPVHLPSPLASSRRTSWRELITE